MFSEIVSHSIQVSLLVLQIFLLLLSLALVVCLVQLSLCYLRPRFSPVQRLRGPKRTSWLFGNMLEMINGNCFPVLSRWRQEYGHVFALRDPFGSVKCVITDKKAVGHVLNNTHIYWKPEEVRYHLSFYIGRGLVSVEGAEHTLQRRIMTPAFSMLNIRGIFPVFISKSAELVNVLRHKIETENTPIPTQSEKSTELTFDVFEYLSYATLDIIGLTGFNFDFRALPSCLQSNSSHGVKSNASHENEEDNLDNAWHVIGSILAQISSPTAPFPVLLFCKGFIPFLRIIDESYVRPFFRPILTRLGLDRQSGQAHRVQAIFRAIGMHLIRREKQNGVKGRPTKREKEEGADLGQGRDLLSLMMKSNMASNMPADKRLSISQILGEIPTFMIAGHETTATTLTWCLLELSKYPRIQARLREEVLNAFPVLEGDGQLGSEAGAEEEITPESVNALPYLEAVARESLRFAPPIENTSREALQDDVIPVEKPYMDKNGQMRNYIEVKKGDQFLVPFMVMNRLTEVWGEDANRFNPDRWLNPLPDTVHGGPGVYGNIMSFSAGPKGCIGFKFAMLEFKVLLLHLIRAFEFELAVPVEDVKRVEVIVSKPFVTSQPEKDIQLPMTVRPVFRTF
ncbi:cytochrome P450 [Serendipita vermifera]|nr:cytochrome P450 [Serendipita vermifera]